MKLLTSAVTICICVLLYGCSQDSDLKTGKVVAKIGDKTISLEQLKNEVSYVNSKSVNISPAHYKAVLERMIDYEIIVREGKSLNLNLQQNYANGIKKIEAKAVREKQELMRKILLDQIGENIIIPETEVTDYYSQSKGRFLTDSLHLRRITVDTEKQIRKIERKIKSGKRDFSVIAGKVNVDVGLRKQRGDMGVYLRNKVPRNMRIAAFSLKKNGQVSKPFFADKKWNLLQLVRKETGIERPFVNIKVQMEQELRRNKAVKVLKKTIDAHRQKIKVVINQTELAKYTDTGLNH